MRWSNSFIPTRKEVPKDADSISHKLLLRAGLIKSLASGVYSYLPLGWRILKKIQKIIRCEMDRIGAQELLMPALTPSSIWEETGRWEEYGGDMFRLSDRRQSMMALAPTHEEVITSILRDEIDSYRALPQIWYQIQVKYRDEVRPRGAVLRARSFLMKDSYSFDIDEKGLERSFQLHEEAYKRIFEKCGLETTIVSASSGLMGGSESKEFMVTSEAGEDTIIQCSACNYSSNIEASTPIPSPVDFKGGNLEKVQTPVKGSVKVISNFLEVPESQLMKSLLYINNNNKPVWVTIRGDYEVNEEKLEQNLGEMRIATEEEVKEYIGASIGYVSPVKTDYPVYADYSIKGVQGLVSGANEDDYHYTGINPERDLNIKEYIDIREYRKGDLCPECGAVLEWKNAIELGHIFKLGTKYSKAMNANYLDEKGNENPIVMGSYGIGVERIMAAAIEQYHDEHGIIWPASITPYQILLINLNASDKEGVEMCDNLYRLLSKEYEILYDDRDERAGYKFNDADLIGIPIQIIVGSRGLKKGVVEIKLRKEGKNLEVSPDNIEEETGKLWQKISK